MKIPRFLSLCLLCVFFSLPECNPRYILRNWMAQIAIEKAEKDDFTEVCICNTLCQLGFDTQTFLKTTKY